MLEQRLDHLDAFLERTRPITEARPLTKTEAKKDKP